MNTRDLDMLTDEELRHEFDFLMRCHEFEQAGFCLDELRRRGVKDPHRETEAVQTDLLATARVVSRDEMVRKWTAEAPRQTLKLTAGGEAQGGNEASLFEAEGFDPDEPDETAEEYAEAQRRSEAAHAKLDSAWPSIGVPAYTVRLDPETGVKTLERHQPVASRQGSTVVHREKLGGKL